MAGLVVRAKYPWLQLNVTKKSKKINSHQEPAPAAKKAAKRSGTVVKAKAVDTSKLKARKSKCQNPSPPREAGACCRCSACQKSKPFQPLSKADLTYFGFAAGETREILGDVGSMESEAFKGGSNLSICRSTWRMSAPTILSRNLRWG